MTTSRRSKKDAPLHCFSVTVNGKRVATMGVPGEGGISANVSSWTRSANPSPTRSRRPYVLTMYLGATDSNNPQWHRFYEWPAPKLRLGDEVTVRVVEGKPDRPKFRMKMHRIDEDQFPSPENPTFVVVRNVSVWADRKRVHLKSWDERHETPRLTPAAARKVAKALLRAAARVEKGR